jgi:hypothetical protein
MPFSETGLPENQQQADRYAWVKGKGGRVRWIPLDSPFIWQRWSLPSRRGRQSRRPHGRSASGPEAQPAAAGLRPGEIRHHLRKRGATGHGCATRFLNDAYEDVTGVPSPVRGGGPVSPELDRAARLAVSQLAGHAACARQSAVMRSKGRKPSDPPAT